VKPAPFRYEAPTDLDEIHALLTDHGDEAKLLAGGQSLGPLLNLRMSTPSLLVDLRRVSALRQPVRVERDMLRIPALMTYREVMGEEQVRRVAPLLTQAIPYVGHQAIRNAGTIGGSVAHADPAAEVPACVVALDARIGVRGTSGERTVPAAEFFVGTFSTVLEPDEVVAWVDLPLDGGGRGAAWLEVAPRHGDYAVVGVGAVVSVEDGRVASARVCLSGVSDTPTLLATERLLGTVPSDDALLDLAAEGAAGLALQDDLVASAAYKRHLVKTLTARALGLAVRRTEERGREAS
jgi:carbon-monoxide dehydrogenase medium subunit